jgi:hypothetical protein
MDDVAGTAASGLDWPEGRRAELAMSRGYFAELMKLSFWPQDGQL